MKRALALPTFLCLAVPMAGFSPIESVAADPPKPGSAEWNRRLREHERRMLEHRRKLGSSSLRNSSPSTLQSPNSSTRRTTTSSKSSLGTGNTSRPSTLFGPRDLQAAMSPSQRRIYSEASSPKPLDKARAPRPEQCLLMFRDALNKGERFDTLLRCLAAQHRKSFVERSVNPNLAWAKKSETEFMAGYRRVVGHITKVDGVRAVSGVPGRVHVWAWVESPGLSRGLYKFTMEGEGRFYRLAGYEADVIQLD